MNIEDKKEYKKFAIIFARHCMMELLTKPPVNEGGYPEISSYDLYRIEKIISKYSK